MIFLLFSLLLLSDIEASGRCKQNGMLTWHKETVNQRGISFDKLVVNRSRPVEAVFVLYPSNTDIKSVSWEHNGEPIKVEDNPNREVHYTVEPEAGSLKVTLHIGMPTARVTGNWTITLKTADSGEHIAMCLIEAPPMLRPRMGAVRANEGNPLSFTCELDSYPPPDEIQWKQLKESEHGSMLIPVTDATFKSRDGVKNAVLEWADATNCSGFYLCTAISPRGSDSLLVEVRIKGKFAYVWPCIGIALELIVLLITIVVYERAQAKRRKAEEQRLQLKVNDPCAKFCLFGRLFFPSYSSSELMKFRQRKSSKVKDAEHLGSSADTLSTSEFVRQFVRRHVAPSQRGQSDIPLRPGSFRATYNLNLLPQSTKLIRNKTTSTAQPRPNLSLPVRQRSVGKRHLTGVAKTAYRPAEIPVQLPEDLHKLWLGYMQTVVNCDRLLDAKSLSTRAANASQTNHLELLLRMNLIGAKLRVVRSTSACLAGRKGIVIMETKNLFRLALNPQFHSSSYTDGSTMRLVSVPKAGSIFLLLFTPDLQSSTDNHSALLLNGDHLTYRPLDRAVRKWRRPPFSVPLSNGALPSSTELSADLLDSFSS
ncbi:hypothetical protein EG68_03435 [Paragonimus skrjabini miyazakii]|uniref:Ribonuclease P protein subunit p29 n=1 Tax=Paragonimus skrjabini miyazakii TaxID=59628 RepID=A0A8S9YWJ4_9TREM|nr:hypothetical protein EG68_03435 [Paragonimus skrjabini miyazakii]